MDIFSYFCPSSSKSAATIIRDSEEDLSVGPYIIALLRENVPVHVLSCEDITENRRKVFHG